MAEIAGFTLLAIEFMATSEGLSSFEKEPTFTVLGYSFCLFVIAFVLVSGQFFGKMIDDNILKITLLFFMGGMGLLIVGVLTMTIQFSGYGLIEETKELILYGFLIGFIFMILVYLLPEKLSTPHSKNMKDQVREQKQKDKIA